MKSRGIKLPEVHGIGKCLDLNIQLEKQIIKPMITKVKEVSTDKTKVRTREEQD